MKFKFAYHYKLVNIRFLFVNFLQVHSMQSDVDRNIVPVDEICSEFKVNLIMFV